MINIVDRFLNIKKKINIDTLPSQGYFYKNDFRIYINRASEKSIENYKNNIDITNIMATINIIKKIVKENSSFSKKYKFEDLKSVDIIFIFLEIVKFSLNKKILIYNEKKEIEFSSKNFKYFFTNKEELLDKYDKKRKMFVIDGYKFSLPSIGVENSLTTFLIKKIDIEKDDRYIDYFYDFTYFVGHKNYLEEDEIENLIDIFNFEIEKKESEKIKKIIELFIPMQSYQLLDNDKPIELTSKIDLKKIWD